MGKKKSIRHMGMTMSEEEHRRWHEQHDGKGLTPAEHQKLMEHLGISREEDRQWHGARGGALGTPDAPTPDEKPVNCFAIGGGFLDYCVKQGWLTRQRRGKTVKHYVTEAGRKALAGFGITSY